VVVDERTVMEAALAAGVSVRCARKWATRYRQQGEAGLRDRSSAPHRIPHATTPERVKVICDLRRLRFTSPEIAETLSMPISTVSAVLKRSGMGKLGWLGLEPAQRYEHTSPGDLIHVDVKKLGKISERGAGTGSLATARASSKLAPSGSGRRAGSSCMLRSTTTAAWPTSRF
jgi:hypothetical protein